MGSIHAIHTGAGLLRWWLVASIVTGSMIGTSLVDRLGSTGVDFVLAALLAIAGWRMFGPSPRERAPWARWILSTAWFVSLVPAATGSPLAVGVSGVGLLVWLATVLHVASHTRRGTAIGTRSRIDIAAASFLCALAGAAVAFYPFLPDQTVSLSGWAMLLAIPGITALLWGLIRTFTLRWDIDPGTLPPEWQRTADALSGAESQPGRAEWTMTFPVGERSAVLRVRRDPIPPWTELELPVPELRGLTARRRRPDEVGGLPLGDLIVDDQLYVDGDPERAHILSDLDGPWLEILHGWRGVVRDGVLTARFEGDVPRSEWLGGPASCDLWDDAIVERLVDGCRRAVVSLEAADPATAVDTRQRSGHSQRARGPAATARST